MYRIVVISMFMIQDPTLPSSHIEKNILELRKKDTRKKKKKKSPWQLLNLNFVLSNFSKKYVYHN